MEKDRVQRYVESLQRTIQNNHRYLKEAIEEFQENCRMVIPGRHVPPEVIMKVRENYKEIRNRLTEIQAIQQLLRGKYRQYYHRDPLRDKEVMEFGFVAKNCYLKFDSHLKQIEVKKKLGEPSSSMGEKGGSFRWFRAKENQVTFRRNLRIQTELEYETSPEKVGMERRDLTGVRSLTLFLFYGDPLILTKLQSHISLREHDILERYSKEEIRGVLTHLREISTSEVETLFQRFMERGGFSRAKCLLLTIQSEKDLPHDVFYLIKRALREMEEGKVKTLSIC